MTFMNEIWISQDKNQKKDQLNCSNENITKWREKVMLQVCLITLS